jgi:PRC-barrel domain
MLKKLLIVTAVSGITATAALAQATNPPASSPPAANPPSAAAPLKDAKFVAAQGADQWVFSKFRGTDVIGPDNAHVGDVTDLLFDKSGKVIAAIVGVGGFLGIGEKNVAIDMSAFEVVRPDPNSVTVSRSDDPSNIKLKVSWTKDQLKQAPDFQYFKATATVGQRDRLTPAPRPATPTPAER